MAASLVGGAFLSASLQVLFDRLASREVVNFFKGREKLNGKLIKKLKITLISVKNLLDDAEEKQITNPHVKQWLDELKDAVYVADDLLDEIAYEAKLLDSNGAESCQLPKIFASLSTDESKLGKQLEEVLEIFKDLMEQKDALGLMEGTTGLNPFPQLERRTTSLVDESGVYGRDADKEAIIRMLLADEDICPGVIPIVGMGGVGKTTLAQLVYKDDRVKQKFQIKAWVCVSEEFDVFKVARSVLKEFAPGVLNTDGMTPNQLHNELEERLMGQKFFLVLDDMWDESHKRWDILLLPLKSGAQGSRIIVTTRSNTVASVTRTSRTHHLRVLSNEHCWSLFARRAFKNENCIMFPKLEGIGKEIVSKCKGLPLAANTLGCLLSSERDARKWERILKSNMWDIQGEHILPALRLSYHYLPPNLKRCFAYCAIFPKSYQFGKEEVVHLWMAEGFLVLREGNLSMKEIGDEYFDGLVSRLFLQRSAANRFSFVMHDLFHDLAKSISGDFCLRLEADDLLKIPPKTRHLSYAPLLYNASEKFAGIDEAQQLRAFLPIHMSRRMEERYIDKEVIQHLLPTLKRLRVLSLSCYVNIIDFPESITKMKHLQSLDFSGTSIKNLPSAISNLFNLQTLNLEYCEHLVELPDSIGSLKYLQYLNLGGTAIKQLPEFSLCPLEILILHTCKDLIQLPSNLGTLAKLCNLDISETELLEMPPQFGNLTNLKYLSDFFVGDQTWSSLKELRRLQNLEGELCVWHLQNVANAQDASEADLDGKENLKRIDFIWDGDVNDSRVQREVLERLRPHTGVDCVSIFNYGGTTFPEWVGNSCFSCIVSMELQGCTYCYALPPLGQLESLKQLFIGTFDEIEFVGASFYGCHSASMKKPFRSLEILRFEAMYRWRIWEDEDGAFPCLRELYIEKCPDLTEALPRHLPSLSVLEIIGCDLRINALPRAPAIRKMRIKDNFGGEDLQYISNRLDVLNLDFPILEVIEQIGLPATNFEEIKVRSCHWFCCSGLESFPMLRKLNIKDCPCMESFFLDDQGGVTNFISQLESLTIDDCPFLVYFAEPFLAPNLTKLCLQDLFDLKSLPKRMSTLVPCLVHLNLQRCRELESFPEEGLPSKLQSLVIEWCEKLVANRTQWNLQVLPSLSSISIGGYYGAVESFPEELLLPSTLTSLKIWYLPHLKYVNRKGLEHLTSMRELMIWNCPQLQNLSEEVLPSTLRILHLKNLNSLNSAALQRLTYLGKLAIENCPKLRSVPEEGLPSSITSLEIRNFKHLRSLDYKGFQSLSSLRELKVADCPRIQSLPEGGLPSSLSSLVIQRCSLLAKRCGWEGEDWPKISHILSIQIDGRFLK